MKKFLASLLLFLLAIGIDHRRDWSWIYTHWLFDYHFGFIKRGLVGAGLHLISSSLPLLEVQILSILMAAAVTIFFIKFFWDLRACWNHSILIFAVFVFFSPLSVRNYFYDLGRFDQLSMVLILLQWFNIPLLVTAALATALVAVHENFFFIFLPALSFILYQKHGLKKTMAVIFSVTMATFFVFIFGHPSVGRSTLFEYLQSKATIALDDNLDLFYVNAQEQFKANMAHFEIQKHFWYGYLLYASFLIPLVLTLKSITTDKFEKLIFAGLVSGYLFIFIFTCDWCRHLTNLFLILAFLILYLYRQKKLVTDFEFFKSRWRYFYFVLFLLPAAGVEIPRLVKLFPVFAKYL